MHQKTGISTSPSTSLSAIPSTTTCLFLNKVDTLKSTLFKKRHSPQALGIKVEYLGSIVTKHIGRVNMATKKLGFSDYSR